MVAGVRARRRLMHDIEHAGNRYRWSLLVGTGYDVLGIFITNCMVTALSDASITYPLLYFFRWNSSDHTITWRHIYF